MGERFFSAAFSFRPFGFFGFAFFFSGFGEFGEGEVHSAGDGVDADDGDFEGVADFNSGSLSAALDVAAVLVDFPPVVAELIEGDEALDHVALELDEGSEVADSGDESFEPVSDPFAEELEDEGFLQLAFGLFGAFFGEGAMFAKGGKLGLVLAELRSEVLEFILEMEIQESVDVQIGVPSDGRGEVAIMGTGEGKVAHFDGGVFGPLEGAEDGIIHGKLVGFIRDGMDDGLEVEAIEAAGNFMAEHAEEFPQIFEGIRSRIGMDAAEEGNGVGIEEPGDGLVRLDHEHFNDGVGVTGIGGVGVDKLPFFVIIKFHFGQVQMEHSRLSAAGLDTPGEFFGVEDQIDNPSREVAVLTFENAGGLFVGQAFRGPDDGIGIASAENVAMPVVANESGFGESILSFLEAAQAITQGFRDHGNDMARQIDAVGAGSGFLVECGIEDDEGGNVGDMDAKFVAVVQHVDADCVVEIAGIDGIDGDDQFIAKIGPTGGDFSLAQFPADGLVEFFDDIFQIGVDGVGKLAREIEFVDDGLEFDVGFSAGSEEFEKHAAGGFDGLRIFGELDDDAITGPDQPTGNVIDDDRLMDNPAIGLDHPMGGPFHKGSDEFIFSTGEDFFDPPVQPRLTVDPPLGRFGLDEVAGQSPHRRLLRNVQVLDDVRVAGHDEPEAFDIEAEGSHDGAGLAGEAYGAVLSNDQPTAPMQVVHLQSKEVEIGFTDTKGPGQVFELQGFIGPLGYGGQDFTFHFCRHFITPQFYKSI